jgi:hypothetical protein
MVELAPRIRIRGIWSITVFARSRNGGGKADEANFISFTCGSHGEGTLPAAGDYTVRAYLMRRDEVGRYRLEIVIDSSKSIGLVNRSTAAGQASEGDHLRRSSSATLPGEGPIPPPRAIGPGITRGHIVA